MLNLKDTPEDTESLKKRIAQLHFTLWAVLRIHGPTLIGKHTLEAYGNTPVILAVEPHQPSGGFFVEAK